ncbi:uncharacterized protein F4817DRAFT_311006 [Daldinia loculata]|uniref:uncharacterized protein n=1 Tax=Daldinia loculata TaxID=103429 RepID=UPI0020C29D59|nr:uncharacterized protein F4817DRAFT_311006 [Daldinia loculata]KAI1652129.1 hypothetical protein F4817DRAFT_311006 [Daldinia loculata]
MAFLSWVVFRPTATNSNLPRSLRSFESTHHQERICVANHRWEEPNAVLYTFGTGTSEAAVTTAGLAAYLIQVDNLQNVLQLNNGTATARDKVIALKHYIEDSSFPRGALTPRAIWNSQVFKPSRPDLREFDCERLDVYKLA